MCQVKNNHVKSIRRKFIETGRKIVYLNVNIKPQSYENQQTDVNRCCFDDSFIMQ